MYVMLVRPTSIHLAVADICIQDATATTSATIHDHEFSRKSVKESLGMWEFIARMIEIGTGQNEEVRKWCKQLKKGENEGKPGSTTT